MKLCKYDPYPFWPTVFPQVQSRERYIVEIWQRLDWLEP